MIAPVLLTCQHIRVDIPVDLTGAYLRHARRKGQHTVMYAIVAQHILLVDIILL